MNTLCLSVTADGGLASLNFPVQRVINAGYAGRDQQAVLAHIAELQREGVAPPPAVPMFYPLSSSNVTTADQIEVCGGETSGEAEYVLLLHQREIFIAVGSDHTDRELERTSVLKSKQICANVLSPQVWRFGEVRQRWDSLLLRSWAREPHRQQDLLYQEAPLSTLLRPEDLLERVQSRLRSRAEDGVVIYSGTVPLKAGSPIYADHFRAELIDTELQRRLTCAYRVVRLDTMGSDM